MMQVVDDIIAEELQRQEYSAAWTSDDDCFVAAAKAALCELDTGDPQPAHAEQVAWPDEDDDELGLQRTA